MTIKQDKQICPSDDTEEEMLLHFQTSSARCDLDWVEKPSAAIFCLSLATVHTTKDIQHVICIQSLFNHSDRQ